jgi:hypothetical protein
MTLSEPEIRVLGRLLEKQREERYRRLLDGRIP